MAQTFVDEQVKSKPVVVYSKTYCPYCTTAKGILKEVGLDEFLVVELDERSKYIEKEPQAQSQVSSPIGPQAQMMRCGKSLCIMISKYCLSTSGRDETGP